MPTGFKRIRYQRPKFTKKSYHVLMKALQDSLALEISDVAAYRIHVITHYYKYGLRPTLDAFKHKKSSLYNWINAYEKQGRNLVSQSIEQDLMDGLGIAIIPVTLGDGVPFFGKIIDRKKLELVECKHYSLG